MIQHQQHAFETEIVANVPLKERIYKLLNEPSSGFFARVFAICSLLMIVGSTTAFIVSTVPNMSDDPDFGTKENKNMWFAMETGFVVFFTIEYISRWVVDHYPIKFVYQPVNIIDLAAIVPYYLELIFKSNVNLRYIRTIRLARVFRVLKLGKSFGGTEVLVAAVQDSLPALSVPFFMLIIGVIIFASLLHAVERGEYDEITDAFYVTDSITGDQVRSEFISIPESLWWALVTVTTVGYGDASPNTPWGKVAASACMIYGIFFMAMPIAIIGQNFINAWDNNMFRKTTDGSIRDDQSPRTVIPDDILIVESSITQSGGLLRVHGTTSQLPSAYSWSTSNAVATTFIKSPTKSSATTLLLLSAASVASHFMLNSYDIISQTRNVDPIISIILRRDRRLSPQSLDN